MSRRLRRSRMPTSVVGLLAAALAGCGIVSLDGPSLSLRFGAPAGVDLEALVILDGRAHALVPGDQRDVDADAGHHGVFVEVVEAGGGVVGSTRFDMTFRDDSDHWVDVRVGIQRPFGHCAGQSTPLGVVGADSVFVFHGGIPRDAIC